MAFPSFYMLATLALGAVLVERGETQFTNIFTVVMGVFMCAQFVGISIVYTPSVVLVKRAAKNIIGIINLPSEDDAARAIKKEGHNGDIAFTNVSFKYPTRPDVPILKDVSFTILVANRLLSWVPVAVASPPSSLSSNVSIVPTLAPSHSVVISSNH